MGVTVFCRYYDHLPPLAEDAVRTPRSVAKYFDFLDLFRQVEDVLMSISRPARGTFQENKNKEKLVLSPKFTRRKGYNLPILFSFLTF